MSGEEIMARVLQLERKLERVEKRINEGIERDADLLKLMIILEKRLDCLAEVIVAEESEVSDMN